MVDRLGWSGGWCELKRRLDGSVTLVNWSEREVALTGLRGLDELASLTARGADPERADAVLGALVRLAAADGLADDDALLVLLHLLGGVVTSLSRQLADLTDDMEATVLSELACQIRAYPWRRRTRAFAANLHAETRRAVLTEFRPWARVRPAVRVEPWDPTNPAWEALLRRRAPDLPEDDDIDVVELMTWAWRRGLPGDDLALLVATERAKAAHPGVSQDRRVAAAHDVPLRTFYRKRERTLSALRSAARDYLAATA